MTNRLKNGQRYRLWLWVQRNTEVVQNATDTEAAKLSGEAMGFAVTKTHIVHARKSFGIRRRGVKAGVAHG